jgi:hypothetical protein
LGAKDQVQIPPPLQGGHTGPRARLNVSKLAFLFLKNVVQAKLRKCEIATVKPGTEKGHGGYY